jgi:PP-loop superfamily ATP-utilizing enzyme
MLTLVALGLSLSPMKQKRGRPKLKASMRRGEHVMVLLTKVEKDAVEAFAQRRNMTLSDAVRLALREAKVVR